MQSRTGNIFTTAVTIFAALALAPSVAQAQYLDPGAGSLVVQVVIAGIVGASAFFKIYWHKISSFLDRRSKSKR